MTNRKCARVGTLLSMASEIACNVPSPVSSAHGESATHSGHRTLSFGSFGSNEARERARAQAGGQRRAQDPGVTRRPNERYVSPVGHKMRRSSSSIVKPSITRRECRARAMVTARSEVHAPMLITRWTAPS